MGRKMRGGTNLRAAVRLWRLWKRVARRIGDFQARVLMLVFYFVIFCPFALTLRWGSDPLAIKSGARRGWRPKQDDQGAAIDLARRQY
jgi:hypothetical protein